VLSPVAYLAGLNTVREACEDAVVGKYVRKAMYDELIPTLDLSKEELTAFADSVMERFRNPYVNHLVTSIMLNSFPKFKTRDLPALKKYLERKGQLPDALVFGLAAIISYYKGGKRGEDTIVLNDDPKILDLLSQLWQTNDPSTIAEGVLGASFIWAEDLNSIAGLKEKLTGYLTLISQKGMNEALQTIV
ncbi:MAG TPA: tagaturonate reductase, partial [Bacteroidales bacterium]